MKKIKFFSIGLCFALVLAGCNNTQKGAAIGAGGGAVLGAIVGKLAGNTAVGAAVGAAVGTGAGAIIGKNMDKAKAEAEAVQNAKVESVTDANGLAAVKVTFDSGILFATNKADLNIDAKNSLAKFATVLNNNADCDIAIIGHTDKVGTYEANVKVSKNRAYAVENYLQDCGVSPAQFKKVEGVAYDQYDESKSAEENRRVEIYMYASKEMIQNAEAGR